MKMTNSDQNPSFPRSRESRLGEALGTLKTIWNLHSSAVGNMEGSPRQLPARFPEDAPALAISPKSNAAARVVNRLISQGSPVFRALDAVQTENGDLPAGTWVVPTSAESLSLMSEENGAVQVQPLWERPDKGLQMLRAPRIGLYASYVPCIEEGWTRFLFDEYGFKYVSLADRDIREGGLSSRFDCIIIPHQESQARSIEASTGLTTRRIFRGV